jgi:hypothetical protein
MYSVANYPFAGEAIDGPQVTHVSSTVTINSDDPEGGGRWIDLGTVQVSRDAYGATLLMLAHSIDAADEGAGDTRFEIRAVHIEPFTQSGGGGYDADASI